MTKSQLVQAFGKQKDIAVLLGLSKARISQLPENLPPDFIDRVVGAAMRLGVYNKIAHLMEGVNERQAN